MRIRYKIILLVLPVLIVSLLLFHTASGFAARIGITRIAQSLLNFKATELERYIEGQWNLLVEYDFASRPDMVQAAQNAVLLFAQSIILSETEIILALDDDGQVVMSSSAIELSAEESERVLSILRQEEPGIYHVELGGEKRVFTAFYFMPFRWYLLLTEAQATFYRDADRLRYQALAALALISLVSVALLVIFARHLTNPLERVVDAMSSISSSGDLSSRVEVEYRDETGHLAATFNMMTRELEKAYAQIKRFAFEAVLAGKKEQRIRQIFQKYVPKDLIDKFFASPESMLIGENRELAILFSDIRSFTTISEKMAPEDLVNSLNRYFSGQVDIIMNRNGIVDKYIGDAIMAFWGAPVKYGDDALQALLSSLDMLEAAKSFNKNQKKAGRPEFNIGIGINFGIVTVGNIGSERKMDYTVIGDMVNLASRMEGLTKTYHADILISETMYEACKALSKAISFEDGRRVSFRLLDTVAVKGKTRGVKIYTVGASLSETEEKAWNYHNQAMELYYGRNFADAAVSFSSVLALLPEDHNAAMLLERCKAYAASPPPEGWDGVEVMQTK
jgi:class 3 adenylate cyclase/HAMP domain-containing protein